MLVMLKFWQIFAELSRTREKKKKKKVKQNSHKNGKRKAETENLMALTLDIAKGLHR